MVYLRHKMKVYIIDTKLLVLMYIVDVCLETLSVGEDVELDIEAKKRRSKIIHYFDALDYFVDHICNAYQIGTSTYENNSNFVCRLSFLHYEEANSMF